MDYRTYQEWAAVGRAVRAGRHAQFYAVNPETKQGVAVFEHADTEPTAALTERKNWPLVPADEYRANRQPKSGPPRVLVRQEPDGTWSFWVGTHPRLNAAFKKGQYHWDLRAWRWRSHPDVKWPPTQVLELLEQGDYTVVREGEPA